MRARRWIIGSSLGLLGLLAIPRQSKADPVVFSNLGPGDSYIGSCTCGWGVGNGWYGSVAVPFTPTLDVELSQILIALTSYYGANSGSVELVNDNAGKPGSTVLESWSVGGLPSWQSASTIQPSQTLTASPGLLLSGGTQYWIVAQTANGFIWMPNIFSQYQVNGQFPVCSNGCTNEFDTQFAPAFEVTATPEPSSLVLLCLGFLVLALFLRRVGQAHTSAATTH